MTISKEALEEVALSEKEYKLIVQRLGREPNEVELGLFGSLWSEHCGYKHSRPLFKLLPSKGKRVVVGLGEENAGAVDIGDGWVAIFKMESHNHPSAVDPFEGAATAVGGVIRDIFTMGARPIALFSSLRFGPLTEANNRSLLIGAVKGIASYGNGVGIPGVGGEIFFADSYTGNPLVNGLCLGICRKEGLVKANASGTGNLVVVVGASTGRDGIHGASGLASRTFEDEQESKSTVPAGNPALEKILIEACLELAQTDWIVGMQDLGAAGLTSSTVECAAKGGGGVEIDVLKVSRSEGGMTPYEIMLSESQERMMVVVRKDCEGKVKALLDRWGLHYDIVGSVTDTGMVVVKEGEKVVANVPVNLLVTPPLYRQRSKRPKWLDEVQSLDLDTIPDLNPRQCNSILIRLLASPNIASKEWAYRQGDSEAMGNTVVPPGNDAAVLRVKDSKKGIALTADGNGRYCYLAPYLGGAIAIAEAARNLVCCGAEPVAVTDCLNLGSPEKDDVYYQLRQSIEGLARACRELRVSVVSGNVSLYNETRGQPIYPTPIVGMVGVMDDVEKHCTTSFKNDGDLVFLLGGGVGSGLGGSEYLELVHGLVRGLPSMDLDLEKRVQRCCLEAIQRGFIKSAHDCSDGGLAVAIAESCIAGSVGFRGQGWKMKGRVDETFFGEVQSRIVVSISPASVTKLERLATRWQAPLTLLGSVGGKRLIVKGYVDLPLAEIEEAWRGGLERLLK